MIRLEGLRKRFPGQRQAAVAGVNLQVAPATLTVLLGASGSGKTTTLKMVNRLVEPSSGRALINGVDVATQNPVDLRRSVGYVFQGIGLFPHLSIEQNLRIVPDLLGWPAQDVAARVSEMLELIGLSPEEYGQRYPAELSGGEQQRVGVARALAGKPQVLLMDEPFGALDPLTRDRLQTELRNLQQQLRLTILMVTHDVTEALLLADQIAVMKAGQIVAQGTPKELMSGAHGNADDYVAALMSMPKRQARAVDALMDGS